jgi:hypothetical protein
MANTRSAEQALGAFALAVLVVSCDRRSEPIAAVPRDTNTCRGVGIATRAVAKKVTG